MKVRGLKVQEEVARRGHRAEPHLSCPPLPARIQSVGREIVPVFPPLHPPPAGATCGQPDQGQEEAAKVL